MSKPSSVPARSACHRMSHLTSPEAAARSLAVSLCVVRLGPVLFTAMVTRPGYRPQRNGGARLADACSPEPQRVHQDGQGPHTWPLLALSGPGSDRESAAVAPARCGIWSPCWAWPSPPRQSVLVRYGWREAIPSRRGHAGEPGAMQAGQCRESPPSYAMPLWAGTEWADEGRCDPH